MNRVVLSLMFACELNKYHVCMCDEVREVGRSQIVQSHAKHVRTLDFILHKVETVGGP